MTRRPRVAATRNRSRYGPALVFAHLHRGTRSPGAFSEGALPAGARGAGGARRTGAVAFREAEALPVEDLTLAHDPGYVGSFLDGTLDERAVRRIGLRPWTEAIVERTLLLTNGTVEATRHVVENGGIGGNLAGGTHHAYADFGSGYCIFNDLALAARMAQRDYEAVRRVLVLDLDVHQGDGTAAIFERDPTVRTVSLHCGKNFPFRKMRSDLDVPLEPGTKDDAYLATLRRVLDEEFEQFPPDLVLYQAGVDGLAADRLGHLCLSREGLRRRNSLVFEAARGADAPVVVTMGGGYAEPIEASAAAHVDLFRQAAGLELAPVEAVAESETREP